LPGLPACPTPLLLFNQYYSTGFSLIVFSCC